MDREEVDAKIKQFKGKKVRVTRKEHKPVVGRLKSADASFGVESLWVNELQNDHPVLVQVPLKDIGRIEEAE